MIEEYLADRFVSYIGWVIIGVGFLSLFFNPTFSVPDYIWALGLGTLIVTIYNDKYKQAIRISSKIKREEVE